MLSQEEAFKLLIHVLEHSNVLPNLMIVGSWAEYLYSKTKIVNYDFSLKTQDIDIFLPNIHRPSYKINLGSELENAGFKPIFQGNGLVKFNYYGIVEVEFLSRELGRGQIKPYDTNLSIPAQGLRDTDILLFSPVSTQFNGTMVNIPTPEAYIIHKLVINIDRSPLKKEKDIIAIKRLFAVCCKERTNFSKALSNVYDSLTKKQKKKLQATLEAYPLELADIKVIFKKISKNSLMM